MVDDIRGVAGGGVFGGGWCGPSKQPWWTCVQSSSSHCISECCKKVLAVAGESADLDRRIADADRRDVLLAVDEALAAAAAAWALLDEIFGARYAKVPPQFQQREWRA